MNNTVSPVKSLLVGYLILGLFIYYLHCINYYGQSDFVRWGPPVRVGGYEIKTQKEFYGLLAFFFVHQMSNTWISESVYPWILNSIQDHKAGELPYNSITKSLLVVNFNTIYSIIDIFFIVSSVSQISFLLALVFANVISTTIVNYRYLREKKTIRDRLLVLV